MAHKRGRPSTPLDPEASCAARLGYELRTCRQHEGLTLEDLAGRIGFTPQRISEVERAKATPSQPFIAACEDALHAAGKLLPLLPDAQRERDTARQTRADARRAARQAEAKCALPCPATHSDAGDDDVEPTDRRGLLGAGAAVALGGLGVAAAPARAGDVDPELPAHLTSLLNLLGRHDDAFGPRDAIGVVRRELRRIAGQRAVARGELRVALMRVEACWSEFGAWLAHDCGDERSRDALLDRALLLAREADYPDMLAWTRARQAQWSDAPQRAIRLAEDGLRTPLAGAHTRAMCATRAAYAYARNGDAQATAIALADAEHLASVESAPLPAPDYGMTELLIRRWEARCWAELDPAKGVLLYDTILRNQPRTWVREQGLYLAYVARASAAAGEVDRAKTDGARALAIFRQTQSATAGRELRQLGALLNAN
jgi:transcriptional regulator with XRE-family HTH domain